MATRERSDAAQETASDLSTDLRSVYGLRAISMFARPKVKKTTKPNRPADTPFRGSEG